ncbi:unnamed protein product [Nippostrongylus brasiliensis]|uniref:Arp2/3 complex 41 kDa subunit n=1 Tax=Nippostrongylus brasiliensis TaxID=27835 RepID=A0A0N4YVL2_NIPBR|nr:unnamed protein product [Nippostrongylus brasiliensis]
MSLKAVVEEMRDTPVQHWNLGIGPITCHAWNKDRTQIAVSASSNEIHIFSWRNGDWVNTCTLTEHDLPVTGLDWAPNTNRIVSCSRDKNAFVWTFDKGVWKPELVLVELRSSRLKQFSESCVTTHQGAAKHDASFRSLQKSEDVRFQRAATCVKWSPAENKFAVGSGSRLVSVCYYEKENDWWVAKQIRKPIRSTVNCIDWHPNNVLLAVGACDFRARVWVAKQIRKPIRSTVNCIDWHPNNVLLAVGACDFRARVFSAWVKEVDEKPSPNPWGSKMPFGQLLAEFQISGWVHHVAFSPSGCRLAFVAHDSSISYVDANQDNTVAHTLRTRCLPFTSAEWVTENSIVVAGHDYSPVLYTVVDGGLKEVCKLDVPSEERVSSVNSALQMFRNIDRNAASEQVNVQLKTLHQNMIT